MVGETSNRLEEMPMKMYPGRACGSMLALVLVAAARLACAQEDAFVSSGSSPALDQLKLGYVAMGEGAFETALDHYRSALENANTRELRFQSLVGLGSAQAALDRLEDARVSYNRALEIKPQNPETLYAAGMVARDQQRFDDAAELFARAAVRKPDFSEALTQLGVIYAFQGRYDEAAAACWRAVSVAPQELEALLCLGVARYHMGLYAEAAGAFEAVLEIDPLNPRARYSLGLCKLYLEDTAGAITEYTALKDLDPTLASDLYGRIYPPR
jgi:tetratricopeptide (TPR) repeat protein